MNYTTKAFLSALCISAAFGLTACSDDKSSSPSNDPINPNTPDAPVIPEATVISPVRFSDMTATANGDQTIFKINGDAHFDLEDTTSLVTGNAPVFTKVEFALTKVVNNTITGTTATITPTLMDYSVTPATLDTQFPDKVNFSELNLTVSNVTECGTYQVFVTAYASDDATKMDKFISKNSVTFVRDEALCAAQQQQQQQQQQTNPADLILLTKTDISVSTADAQGLSFTTKSAVPKANADITISIQDVTNEIKLTANNGFKIGIYSNNGDKNYDDDWCKFVLPPEPVKLSDFRFREASLGTTISPFDEGLAYVAIAPNYNAETGEGFYAFIKNEATIPDANKDIVLSFIVYSK